MACLIQGGGDWYHLFLCQNLPLRLFAASSLPFSHWDFVLYQAFPDSNMKTLDRYWHSFSRVNGVTTLPSQESCRPWRHLLSILNTCPEMAECLTFWSLCVKTLFQLTLKSMRTLCVKTDGRTSSQRLAFWMCLTHQYAYEPLINLKFVCRRFSLEQGRGQSVFMRLHLRTVQYWLIWPQRLRVSRAMVWNQWQTIAMDKSMAKIQLLWIAKDLPLWIV